MKTIFHSADSRGSADHGWLKAKHSFSFAGYHNPNKIHFGALRVLNDDQIAPGMGFGTHPHENMEIVTIPLVGGVKHKDSTGTEGIIRRGDVQIMSAGSGIYHSEFNANRDELLQLLQIWVMPKEKNIEPRYQQKSFDISGRKNKFQTVVSPKHEEAVWINQDAYFSLASIDANTSLSYHLNTPGNGVYLFNLHGSIRIEDQQLMSRDALAITETNEVVIKAIENAELVAIEVPMHW